MSQNLVIISFDQWRGDWLKVENPVIKLENLTELTRKGVMFERCYTSSPQCVPARLSWLTGLEPSQMGVTKNSDVDLPDDAPSVIRKMKDKGWKTCIIGKTHWTKHNSKADIRESQQIIEKLGFDDVIEVVGPRALQFIDCELTDQWRKEGYYELYKKDLRKRYAGGRTPEAWKSRSTILPPHLYPDIWIANQAIHKIKKLQDDKKPWILWISFVGPHEPFDTPWPWRGMSKNIDLPNAIGERDWVNNQQSDTTIGKAASKWKGKVSQDEIKALRYDYADQLILLDDQVGKVLKELGRHHLEKNTNILVMADHGEMLGDGGMLYKSTFFESAINVPFIYKSAEFSGKNRVVPNVVSLTKIFHQLVENLHRKEQITEMERSWYKSCKAVVEYETERAFISGNKKICVNYEGQIMWATNTKRDPEERKNIANRNKIKNEGWTALIDWAIKETKARNKKEWLWRNLTS